jgi:hypothetical protein
METGAAGGTAVAADVTAAGAGGGAAAGGQVAAEVARVAAVGMPAADVTACGPTEAVAAAVPGGPAAAGAGSQPEGALALDPGERELMIEEIAALGGALHDPEARAPYEELAVAAAAGEVPPALAARLARVLEMSLSTGRARRLHGPQHEAALSRLFFRTPAGAALRQSAEVANRALAALAGQRLEGVAVIAAAPGIHRLRVETDRCQLTLEVSRDGVEVTALEVEI